MNLKELETILGERMIFESYCKEKPGGETIVTYTCRLPNVAIKDRRDASFIRSSFGRAETRQAAMENCANNLAGKWLVHRVSSGKQFQVPDSLHAEVAIAQNPLMEREQARRERGFLPILGVFVLMAALVGVGVVINSTQIRQVDAGYQVTLFAQGDPFQISPLSTWFSYDGIVSSSKNMYNIMTDERLSEEAIKNLKALASKTDLLDTAPEFFKRACKLIGITVVAVENNFAR